LVLLGTFMLALAVERPADAAIRKLAASFQFEGRTVRVEIFRPADGKQRPAALVLHGASGIGGGWFVYPFAEAMARRGLVAAVVHYYDGLGRRKGRSSPRIFSTRDRILKSAISYVLARPDTENRKIGVYGMSLGGFHALSLGVQDARIAAVVSLGGALSGHLRPESTRNLPPTLLLHGDRDRVVPFRRALGVSRLMETYGAPGELKIYKGEGHSLSSRAHKDAVLTTARFMARTLLRRTVAMASPQ